MPLTSRKGGMLAVSDSNQATYMGAPTDPLRGMGNVLGNQSNVRERAKVRDGHHFVLHHDQIRVGGVLDQ